MGTSVPGQNQPQRRAQHPGQRRIKNEARLACAVVCAGQPNADKEFRAANCSGIEPRDQMEVEVVAAGVAAHEYRRNGYEGRQQDDGGTDEAAPAGWASRPQRQELGRPERFDEETKEGHANPLYQYPTVRVRASKKTALRILAMGRITPEQASIAYRRLHFGPDAQRIKPKFISSLGHAPRQALYSSAAEYTASRLLRAALDRQGARPHGCDHSHSGSGPGVRQRQSSIQPHSPRRLWQAGRLWPPSSTTRC